MNVKRIIAIVLLLSASFTAGAWAASNIEMVEAFLRKDYQVFLDGKKVDIGPVLVYKDASYLPLGKISQLLDVDVNWKSANKGIYVNSRFAGQPPSPQDNTVYDSIKLGQPFGYTASYLGGTYPVLANMAIDGKQYYRDTDIQRMGIDTRGLRKAKEQYTKEIYITEDEISKVWKERIVFTPSYEPIVTGESNPEKIKVITDFIAYLPDMLQFLNRDNPNFFYYVPQIFAIDAQGNNVYFLLSQEQGKFVRYTITLKQWDSGKWDYTQYSTTILGDSF